MISTERQVLSAALMHPQCREHLLENDCIFDDVIHQRIYGYMQELYSDNIAVDLPALCAKAHEAGAPLSPQIVSELAVMVPSYNFSYLYSTLQNRARRREVQAIAKDLYKAKNENEFGKFLDELIEVRDNISSDEVIHMRELAGQELNEVYTTAQYIKTGIDGLDQKIIGMFNEQVIIIAARPGRGKTSLAIQIVLNNITAETLFLSGEMGRREIYARMLANRANVHAKRIKVGLYTPEEKERLNAAKEYYSKHSKIILYDRMFSWNNIRKLIRKHGRSCKFVVVDYVQKIRGGSGQNEHMRIAEISGGLKDLAREIQRPIIVLSQLSRDVENQNREPVLKDLRESGALEADADAVWFLHDDGIQTYLIIAKDRDGATGSVKSIVFDKDYCRFRDSEIAGTYSKAQSMDYIHS